MAFARITSLAIMFSASFASAAPPPPPDPQKQNEVVRPTDASEGPRDVEALKAPLRTFVETQQYGKGWKDVVPVEVAPKDKTGIADSKSHPALKNDPIEMQQQMQFLAETKTEARYGWVSIRGVQVFRFGRLVAVQLVFDRIGRDPAKKADFDNDVVALASSWKNVRELLGLNKDRWRIRKNEVAEADPKKAEIKPPLRIAIEPREEPPKEEPPK